jgi:ABC-type transport system involved in multi-copper enzyme maturation permease subunit
MLNHPIVRREFIGTLRKRRAVVAIVGTAVAFVALVVLRWPTDARVDLSGAQSRQVFRIFGYGLMASLLLLTPAFPATSMVREKRRGTLALLLNSPMKPWSIYGGKLVANLGFAVLLVLMSVPAAAACYAMGGVSLAGELLLLYGILGLLMLQYTTLGLLISTCANSTESALRLTYGCVLLISIISLGPYYFLQGTGDWKAAYADWCRCLSPIPAIMHILGQGGVGSQGIISSTDVVLRYAMLAVGSTALFAILTIDLLKSGVRWIVFLIFAILLLVSMVAAGSTALLAIKKIDLPQLVEVFALVIPAILLLILYVKCLHSLFRWIVLNQSLLDRSRSQGLITDERSTLVRSTRRMFFLIDPQRRKSGIGPLTNPVMVKEFRCRRFGRMHWMLRLAAVSAVISLVLTYVASWGTLDWGPETIGGIMVLLQAALIVLLTPSLTAGLISAEIESGGWQLLQMTPLSAGKILRGKLASVVWPVLLILISTLPGYVVMVYIRPEMWLQVRQVLICLAFTALFSISLSFAVSSLFRRAAMAMTVSYSALGAVCGGTMLVWLLRDSPFGHATVQRALEVNPIAAALTVIQTPGFTQYALIPSNWWFVTVASAIFAMIVLVQTHRLKRPN